MCKFTKMSWSGRLGISAAFVLGWVPLGLHELSATGAEPEQQIARTAVDHHAHVGAGREVADRRAVPVFAQTTLSEMVAFDRANPNAASEPPPYMEGPGPQILDKPGIVIPDQSLVSAINQTQVRDARDGDFPSPTLAPPLGASFQGVVDNGTRIPPDTMGAVGPNHVAEMVNSGFVVYSRTGTVLAPQVTLSAFWSSLGTGVGQPADDVFDPKILYDQYTGRWVVTADGNARNRAGGGNTWVLVGISQTSDPTMGWNLYGILGNPAGGPDAANWPDYPGLGVDPNNVIVTNNMFTINTFCSASGNSCATVVNCNAGEACVNFYVHADVWVINKANMMAGVASLTLGVDYALFHNPGNTNGFTFQPGHTFGQTSATTVNYLVNQGWIDNGTRARRFLRINQITGLGATSVLNTFGGNDWIEVSGYNFCFADALQPQCTTPIETNDARMLNAVVRNGKLWATHAVGGGAPAANACGGVTAPTKTEVSWYEINPAVVGFFPGGVPNQQGRVTHASLAYYFPSIAVNKDECVALGFSGSDDEDGTGTFASGFYTMRAGTDPPGTMQPVNVLRAGVDSYWKQFGGSRNRWGDYSATVVDPVDDSTFWTVQEYAEPQSPPGGGVCQLDQGSWGTWWGSFQCKVPETKFSQPPEPTIPAEDVASNLDWVDMIPNIVVADDFQSDGRPITCVRWWGSYVDPAYDPSIAIPPLPIDAWLVSFHEPIAMGNPPIPVLGLYSCPIEAITIAEVNLPVCDAHPVFEYFVELSQCCLIHSRTDSRSLSDNIPAQPDAFHEEECFFYDLDIQAVVGHKLVRMPGDTFCTEITTGNTAVADFWGWHTTPIENGVRPAMQSSVSMGPGGEWLYGPWDMLQTACSPPNMAFELLTDQQPAMQACCLSGAVCNMLFPLDCCAQGGNPQGAGTTCTVGVCGAVCGDLVCTPPEDACTCSSDCGPPTPNELGLCADGLDNDCDGCLDGADTDCGGSETSCTDGVDNDCNGFMDCNDVACFGAGVCCGDGTCDPVEDSCTCATDCGLPTSIEVNCNDGLDDDCNGCIDGADVNCGGGEAGMCADGVDNDCDGCSDGADSQCGGTETSCTDGIDNDCNGFTDCNDAVCFGTAVCCGDGTCDPSEDRCTCSVDCGSPTSIELICTDGLDDDCDGCIDNTDSDCGGGEAGSCGDNIDNDCDGVADCFDPDCATDPLCGPFCGDNVCTPPEDSCNCSADCGPSPGSEIACNDGLDNDCDMLIDCADSDCFFLPMCGGVVCADLVCTPPENQCNCSIDCGVPPPSEVSCIDGIDNDCDTCIDAQDTDCGGSEAGRCGDGLDNDCDGLTDCNDPDCASDTLCETCCVVNVSCFEATATDCANQNGASGGPGTDCLGPVACCSGGTCTSIDRACCFGTALPVNGCFALPTTETACANGVDDDCDGLADCADPDCATDPACCTVAMPPRLEPAPNDKNRFISFVPDNAGVQTALRVTLVSMPGPFAVWNGLQMWVTNPRDVTESGSSAGPAPTPTFRVANMQCNADCRDWGALGRLDLFSEAIVPGATYRVEAVDCRCDMNNPASYSVPLMLNTSKAGDLVGSFNVGLGIWTPPNGSVDITADAIAILQKFSNLATAPRKARVDLEPACLDLVINITDVVELINAFSGGGYSFVPMNPAAHPCQSICP